MRTIVTAYAFLTRIPMPDTGADQARVRAAALWFPLVGLTVGAAVGLVHVGLSALVDPLVAAAVAVSVGVAITGGFHEDGLADTADGFGGGWTVERRLEIMSDSLLGTYGVLAIGCVLLVRVAAVSTLGGVEAVALIATAHLLARTAAVVVMGLARQARPGGLADRSAATGRGRLAVATAAWVLVGGVIVGPVALALVAAATVVVAVATTALAYRKIGGVTGDVLGAVEQLVEAATLVAASALVTAAA
ncbi:MAG: adenosylcobinamide-GDP ribazoletransferase [Actinomycetota bacterium]